MRKHSWRFKTAIPSAIPSVLLVVAVAIVLFFVGMSVYPVDHWYVECLVQNSSGGGLSSRTSPMLTETVQVEDYATGAEKRGETCTVIPVRKLLWAGRAPNTPIFLLQFVHA